MASRRKSAALAHQLFDLSLEDGRISAERVSGVLAWVEKHRPPEATAVLRFYKRLVETEVARNRAVIEFAGNVSPEIFQEIAAAMTKRYGRPIEAVPVACPDLVAGVRVRVGCDIFENSLVGHLASLAPNP